MQYCAVYSISISAVLNSAILNIIGGSNGRTFGTKMWVVRSRRIYLFVNQIKRIFFVDVHKTPRLLFFERLSLRMPSVQLYSRLGMEKF